MHTSFQHMFKINEVLQLSDEIKIEIDKLISRKYVIRENANAWALQALNLNT